MPTLQFKGKSIIWNHHLSVPYYILEDITKLTKLYERLAKTKSNVEIRMEK